MNRKLCTAFVALLAIAAFGFTAVAAQALTPELGRCLKKGTAGGIGYSSATCTTIGTGTKALYEWLPGAANKHFVSAEGKSTFETPGKVKITCVSDTDEGEYTGTTTDTEKITFKECVTTAPKGAACTSAGQTSGTIVTTTLTSTLGVINAAKKEIGVSLEGPEGVFAEFTCGETRVVITGSVIGKVPTNKMESKFSVAYSAAKGKQKPEQFEGAPKDTLTCAIAGKPSEQCGFTSKDVVVNAEPLEIRVLPEPVWWVNGQLFAGSEAIAEATTVTVPFKLEFALEGGKGPKFTIECTKEKVKGGAIEAPGTRTEEAEVYEGCKVVGKEAECTVLTIGTEPLEAHLEGAVTKEKLKFVPKVGSRIAAYKIEGSSCNVKGSYEADGAMICGYEGVETEELEHTLAFTKTSGTLITVNGSAATLTVTDKVHLASGLEFSAP